MARVNEGGEGARGEGDRIDDVAAEAALRAHFAGLELIDRDLDLGAGHMARLVGLEPDGRLLLVIETDGHGDPAALAALDALSFHARHRPVLAQHFEHPGIDPDLDAHVVLLATHFSEGLLARLSSVTGDRLRCYELRSVRSSRGERSYLAPVEFGAPPPERRDPDGRRALLHALASEAAPLAQGLLRRIDRMDEALEAQPTGDGLAWVFDGDELCALRSEGGELQARVGSAGQFVRVASEAESEVLLEEVMEHFRDLLGLVPAGSPPPGIAARLDLDAPILTEEEIAAFREP